MPMLQLKLNLIIDDNPGLVNALHRKTSHQSVRKKSNIQFFFIEICYLQDYYS